MEWVSQPTQQMPFSDMEPGQPNGPDGQLCMVTWKRFEFRWGDHHCVTLLPYICEFIIQYICISSTRIYSQSVTAYKYLLIFML